MNGVATLLTAAVLSAFGIGATSTPAAISSSSSCVDITKTLSVGSTGAEVKRLQIFLGVEQTGYFGKVTESKLIKWQLTKKIVPSARSAGAGTTGPKTRAAMKCVLPPDANTNAKLVPPGSVSTSSSNAPVNVSTPAPAPSVAPSSGGGGPATTISPYGYTCTAPGPKPAASSCTTGPWEIILDEAGCGVWACIDTDERG